jgi:hypothetical protein
MIMPDGSVLLAFNDDPKTRSALTLAGSWNGGNSWEKLVVVEGDPLGRGSFSYPTLQLLPEEVTPMHLALHSS